MPPPTISARRFTSPAGARQASTYPPSFKPVSWPGHVRLQFRGCVRYAGIRDSPTHMALRGGSATSPFRHDATATPRDFMHATPRAGGVSFSSDIHGRDLDPDGTQGHSSKSAAEMHTLRCPPHEGLVTGTLKHACRQSAQPWH